MHGKTKSKGVRFFIRMQNVPTAVSPHLYYSTLFYMQLSSTYMLLQLYILQL